MKTVGLALLLIAGCATPHEVAPAAPVKAQQKVASVKVSPGCRAAVQRQADRSGFAVVITAQDVLSNDSVALLDTIYRRVHGIPGVLSVQVVSDEQVIVAAEMDEGALSFEPLVSGDGHEVLDRARRFGDLLDPALLSHDRTATVMRIKLQPTSRDRAREDVHDALVEVARSVRGPRRLHVVEYPLAAMESMRWPSADAKVGLEVMDERMAGSGVLEVSVSCRKTDCLLDPIHLAGLARLQGILDAMPRVRRTRSLANAVSAAWRAAGGRGRLPVTRDQALGLLARLSGGGFRRYADEHNRRGVVRIYFQAGNASEFCALGKSVKRAAKDATTGTLRFRVRRPDRDGY